MSQAAIVINVSEQEHSHANGLSGNWTIRGRAAKEEFAILVVYPTLEIQDIGDLRRVQHWLKAAPLAKDIVGLRSDASAHTMGSHGGKEKWGLLLCAAEPDLPKELLTAIEDEINFLNVNMPDVKMRKDGATGAIVATNVEDIAVKEKKQELSDKVQKLRQDFETQCRKLVIKPEIARAKSNLAAEDQRLINEADKMWAAGPGARQNINELHENACKRYGQERPWCYIPQQLIDCPGCGAKIKENVLSCQHCVGFLDEGIEELRAMKPKERSMKMYPERYAEPVTAGATGRERG